MIEWAYWLEGVTPWWALLSAMWVYAAIHIRIFVDKRTPSRYWITFFGVGVLIFVLTNLGYFVEDPDLAEQIQFLGVAGLAITWYVFFRAVAEAHDIEMPLQSFTRKAITRIKLTLAVVHYALNCRKRK